MKKRSKSQLEASRRDFLKQSLITSSAFAFSNPAKLIMASLFSEMLTKSAHAANSTDNDFNFVNFAMLGAPPRWMFDNPLRPAGTASTHTPNSMVGTVFDANLNPTYQTVTDPLFNGINMPKLWGGLIPRPGGGTTPMANLAPNMLMIRGLDLALDSHELNPRRQLRPNPGGVSISGLVADIASTPIPAIGYHGSSAGEEAAAFGSAKGLTEAFLWGGQYGGNPIGQALEPFSGASGLTEISSAQVDTAIDNLLNLMRTASSSKHQFLPTSYQSRASAKALMKKNFGDTQAAFNTLRDKYKSLINRSFLEAGLKLVGVDDLVLPGSTTSAKMTVEQTKIYSGSNFNSVFNSSTDIDALASGMAVTEWMLMNRICSSLNVRTGGIGGITYDQVYDTNTQTNASNQVSGFGLDMHYFGSIPTLATMTKFYRGWAACLYELITQLKTVNLPNGKNLFQHTVMQLTGDFGRSARTDFVGSDHAPDASNTTLFSGMITACEVVGNVRSNASSSYLGSYGTAAPVAANQNRAIQLGNQISTVAALLEIPSPTANDSSIVSKNASGNAVVNLPRGTNA